MLIDKQQLPTPKKQTSSNFYPINVLKVENYLYIVHHLNLLLLKFVLLILNI